MDIQENLAHLDELFATKQTEEVEPFLLNCIRQAIIQDDLSATLTYLNEIIGYYRSISYHQEAITMSKQALKLISSMNLEDTISHATTLINVATAYKFAGKLEEALAYYKQAADIFSLFTEENHHYQISSLYNNMSGVYEALNDYPEAINALHQALEHLNYVDGTIVQQAIAYSNLALLYHQSHQQETAYEFVMKANEIYVNNGLEDDNHYPATFSLLGSLEIERANYLAAKNYLLKAKAIQKQAYGYNEGYLEILNGLKQVLQLLNEDDYEVREEIKQCQVQLESHHEISGLMLAKMYYEEYGKPMLEKEFADLYDMIAVGLVGMGSECLGFDDKLSKDHDFGPGFCIFVNKQMDIHRVEQLKIAYNNLPHTYLGYRRLETREGKGRVGVIYKEDFFNQWLGNQNGPQTLIEWLTIPEVNLLTCSNGEIFYDPSGMFTLTYQHVKNYYPLDVKLKKMAACLVMMAQTGQYNYARCMARGDDLAARLALNHFIEYAIHFIHLYNEQYMPYYKWQFKMLERLPKLKDVTLLLKQLARGTINLEKWYHKIDGINLADENVKIIEKIAGLIIQSIRQDYQIVDQGDYLEPYGYALMDQIKNEKIRSLHVMEGI